jgi:hypothetical protein
MYFLVPLLEIIKLTSLLTGDGGSHAHYARNLPFSNVQHTYLAISWEMLSILNKHVKYANSERKSRSAQTRVHSRFDKFITTA